MSDNYPTIYQVARKAAGLTQEQAAEALHVSVETVKAWELGGRTPSNTTVAQMCQAYGTPWLALEHLKETAEQLEVLPSNITRQALPTAAIVLYNRVMAFGVKYRRTEQLLAIAEDGIIDETERPDFDNICRDLDGIVGAALQVKYTSDVPAGRKKDRLTAGTVKRPVPQFASENECRNIISPPAGNASPFLRKGAKL